MTEVAERKKLPFIGSDLLTHRFDKITEGHCLFPWNQENEQDPYKY